ncbi:MAG: hypothetical protein Pg6C_19590 [Treponemataceae bacterium]|nr:MAG: hypothetical protein Pg6C_19590 [Treponemataceae bacterium]
MDRGIDDVLQKIPRGFIILNMTAKNAGSIVFDTNSGISVEEQETIVRQIEEITKTVTAESAFSKTKAAKKGYMFPLIVNAAAAVIVLIAALLALLFWNTPVSRHVEAGHELNSAEGKLIQEIRRQSARRAGEKEQEIADVSEKLADLITERETLADRIEENDEQRIAALDSEIDALQRHLETLQEEQRELAAIGRVAEAELFTRKSGTENAAALEELRALNSEEERYVFFERQIRAFYAQIQENVRQGKIDAAQSDMKSLREFMDNPAFYASRLIQTQRELNLAAAGALSEVIGLVTGDTFAKAEREWLSEKSGLDRQIAALKYRNSQLEKEVAFLQPDIQYEELKKRDTQIQALRSAVTSRDIIIAERDKTITAQSVEIDALIQTKVYLEAAMARRDEQIAALRTQIAALTQTLAARDRAITELQNESDHQRATIAERDATITEQRDQAAALQRTIMDREKTIAELRTESANQRQTIAERDRVITQNRTQITIQQQQINERDRNIAELRVQTENQQQTVTELEKVVEDLRGQTSGGYQAVAERERQIAALRADNARSQQTIAEREADISSLNTRITTLNQTIADRDRTISQLRTQIQNQQQTIAERDRSIQLLMGTE